MTSRFQRLSLLATAGTFAAATASAQVTLLSDDFEVDTSANYTIVTGPVGGVPDGSQEFAFDYVTGGIPLAPRSAMGDTGALRIEAEHDGRCHRFLDGVPQHDDRRGSVQADRRRVG